MDMKPEDIKGIPTAGTTKRPMCWHHRVAIKLQHEDECEPTGNLYYNSAVEEIVLLEEVADSVDDLQSRITRLLEQTAGDAKVIRTLNEAIASLKHQNTNLQGHNVDLQEQVKQHSAGVTFWRDLVKAANDREQAFIQKLDVIHDAARIVFKQSKRR